jgi:hypothetical protein
VRLKLRSRFAGVLSLAVLVSAVAGPGGGARAATPAGPPGRTAFTDVQGLDWALPSIQGVALLGVMNGTGQGKFDPAGTTTRAQLAVVLARLLGWPAASPQAAPPPQAASFRDWAAVPAWAQPAVAAAVAQGILRGEPDGTLRPGDPVTWAQLAVIAVRAFGYPNVPSGQVAAAVATLPEGPAGPPWADESLAQDVQAGDFAGILGALYQPDQAVPRAALAVFLINLARSAANPDLLAGQVSSAGTAGITLQTPGGPQTLALAPGAAVYSGSAPASPSALQPGDSVSVVLSGGQVVWADITSVATATRLSGTIQAVAPDQLDLTLPGGVSVSLALSGSPAVTVEGAQATIAAVAPGADASVTLDGRGRVTSIAVLAAQPSPSQPGAPSSQTSPSPSQTSPSPSQPGALAKLAFSPSPVAAAGALAPGAAATVDLSALDAAGRPAAGATVDLSFDAPAGGGSASVDGVALTAAPQAFTLDAAGRLQIVYTAPAAATAAGSDTIVATGAAGSVTPAATDSYTYEAAAGQGRVRAYAFSPSPIAAAGSLQPGQSVAVTLTAEDAAGNPVPTSIVYLAFAQGKGGGTAWVGGTALSTTPQPFLTDASGHVAITYTAPATIAYGTADTLTAADAASQPAVSGTDAYAFAAAPSGVVAPFATFTASVQSVGGTSLGLLLPDGTSVTLALAPSFTVTQGGQPAGLSAVQVGEPVTVTLNGQDWVTSIAVNATAQGAAGAVGGYLTGSDPAAGTVTVYSAGGLRTYWLAAGATVTLGGQSVTAAQVPAGDNVTLTLNSSDEVAALSAVAPSQETVGVVLSVVAGVLTLQTGATTQTITLGPYSVAVRGGQIVAATALPPGTQVTVVSGAATYGGFLVVATS